MARSLSLLLTGTVADLRITLGGRYARAFWVIVLVLYSRKMENHHIAQSHITQALFSVLLLKGTNQYRVYVNCE